MVAKGFCTSEPIPEESAAGSNPIDPINEIISTERNRVFTALSIVLLRLRERLRNDFIKEVSSM